MRRERRRLGLVAKRGDGEKAVGREKGRHAWSRDPAGTAPPMVPSIRLTSEMSSSKTIRMPSFIADRSNLMARLLKRRWCPYPNLDIAWPRLSINDVCPDFAFRFYSLMLGFSSLALGAGG